MEFSDQPYYHSGMSVTLMNDGFHVTSVAPGSSAESSGLRSGMVLVDIGGLDIRELSRLSNADISEFLALSTRLFKIGSRLEIRTDSGSVHTLAITRQPWALRAPLLHREVLSNLLVGTLFILSGIWLLSVGKNNEAARWFTAFTIAAALAVGSSFFSSYWSSQFLALRFILLDLSGVCALCFLAGFLYRFPDRYELKPIRLFAAPIAIIAVKFVFIALDLIKPYNNAAYVIHALIAVGLIFIIALLARRYHETSAGGKRKLRWILAGVALSVLPYLFYVLSVFLRANILSNTTEILNYIASFSLVLFPVFVIIGVVRYNLFDIDQFLNRFTVYFFLAFLATTIYTMLFLFFFESSLSLEIYLSLLLTALVAPWLYLKIDSFMQRFLWRSRKDKNHILLEMEQELNGKVRASEVYPIVGAAMMSAFAPSYILISHVKDGLESCEYRYPPEPGPTDSDDSGGIYLPLGSMGGAECFLSLGKKKDDDIFTKYEQLLLRGACAQVEKALDICELYTKLQESLVNESRAQRTTILTLAKLTEYRDNETGRHLERIQDYTRLIANRYRVTNLEASYLTEEYIDALCLSAILHDIGKVGIPDAILLKPGRLTPEEFTIIKQHSSIGGKVLEEAEAFDPERSFLTIGKLVAYHHHEKWDGSGYPHGLVGEAIPLSARIVAVADVYDALRSHRPYKNALSHQDALTIIADGKGSHFDPALVAAFLDIEGDIASIIRSS
ncbi:MAG: hypothetical protein A2Y38_01280 [Spirochaetes bacterium GWB1_59_5]|nr:MAG: hypothetical protein A2Y38_01280 [Spirochaetes bacterium GWB1_59_5]